MYFYIILENGMLIENVLVLGRRGLAQSTRGVQLQLARQSQVQCLLDDGNVRVLSEQEVYYIGIMKYQKGRVGRVGVAKKQLDNGTAEMDTHRVIADVEF